MSKDSSCAQHTDCSGYPKTMESALTHRNLLRGQYIPKDKCTQNCAFFVIEGESLINSDEHPGATLHKKQFILQAVGPKYEILTLTDVLYILFWFNESPLLREDCYHEIIDQTESPLTYTPVVMNPHLLYPINNVATYLDESAPTCSRYIGLKYQGTVYIITNYHPLSQSRASFYPISTHTESFQYFVMQNYSKAKNVKESTHLGGHNIVTLHRLFRNLYGVPVYEWMLEKKWEDIPRDLQHFNMWVIKICSRYGSGSLSHPARSCKDSFGDTPCTLRKKAANGEKIGEVTD